MYHKTKRYLSFLVLVGLISVVPAFANPVNVEKTRKSNNFVMNLEENKNPVAESRIVSHSSNHTYRLTLKQGETVSFKLTSPNRTSLKIQSPSGAVKQRESERTHEGVLAGEGEFVFEISTNDFSVYRLEVKRK